MKHETEAMNQLSEALFNASEDGIQLSWHLNRDKESIIIIMPDGLLSGRDDTIKDPSIDALINDSKDHRTLHSALSVIVRVHVLFAKTTIFHRHSLPQTAYRPPTNTQVHLHSPRIPRSPPPPVQGSHRIQSPLPTQPAPHTQNHSISSLLNRRDPVQILPHGLSHAAQCQNPLFDPLLLLLRHSLPHRLCTLPSPYNLCSPSAHCRIAPHHRRPHFGAVHGGHRHRGRVDFATPPVSGCGHKPPHQLPFLDPRTVPIVSAVFDRAHRDRVDAKD